MEDYTGQPTTHGLVALYFSTSWCGPCKRFRPVAEAVFADLDIDTAYFVDAEQHSNLARDYQVTGVPTIILSLDGCDTAMSVGEVSADKLRAVLERGMPGPFEYDRED